ncbi:hypothetical protein [Tessaracoccus oleiagri]|uniref:Uncharacterized protein n=1 Tax=Tessaracoccus oleiagri TaxID=686624 RepID=A0A1G9LTR8_9ACTN|nr:hypothetical protein [Tessaracoccus oleiagri]SDL65492.1 hypothetical protein SAMN04488242_2331 [Tessaracoccus oleiagri]
MATYDPDLADALGGKPRILAEASGRDVRLVGTAEHLAEFRDGEWHVLGWHEVERGSWRGETQTFRWWDMGGGKHTAVLDSEGSLPELVQERVQASTVATFHYDLEPGELRLVARRPLDGSNSVRFYAVTSGGASLEDEATRQFVVQETDRIKREYGMD